MASLVDEIWRQRRHSAPVINAGIEQFITYHRKIRRCLHVDIRHQGVESRRSSRNIVPRSVQGSFASGISVWTESSARSLLECVRSARATSLIASRSVGPILNILANSINNPVVREYLVFPLLRSCVTVSQGLFVRSVIVRRPRTQQVAIHGLQHQAHAPAKPVPIFVAILNSSSPDCG